MRHKTLGIIALAGAVLLAGCSGTASEMAGEPAGTASSSTSEQTPPSKYDSLADLRDAYVAAGGTCDDFKQTNAITFAAESASCGDSTVISTYLSPDAVQKRVDESKELLSELSEETWLVGENWIINAPNLDPIQKALGGTKMSWGNTTPLTSDEELFKSYLIRDEEGFTELDLRRALAIGHKVCEIYDNGDHQDVLDYLIPQADDVYSATQLGAILGIATGSLCREHAYKIPES